MFLKVRSEDESFTIISEPYREDKKSWVLVKDDKGLILKRPVDYFLEEDFFVEDNSKVIPKRLKQAVDKLSNFEGSPDLSPQEFSDAVQELRKDAIKEIPKKFLEMFEYVVKNRLIDINLVDEFNILMNFIPTQVGVKDDGLRIYINEKSLCGTTTDKKTLLKAFEELISSGLDDDISLKYSYGRSDDTIKLED